MPIIDAADFNPTGAYRNGHYNTFIPYLFGSIPKIPYQRERITTPDNDFLDLDYHKAGHHRLAIILHGLEGSSKSSYVRLIAAKLIQEGWDILCPNYRGCSGEMNRQLIMYNSGTTDDLDQIIRYATTGYETVSLIGVSLGGNLALKYMGEGKFEIPDNLNSVVAVSAPVDLADGSKELLKPYNYIYQLNFLLTLRYKIQRKAFQFPGKVNRMKLFKTFNLYDFDEYFTAPIFGYESADDYYADAMSLQHLDTIKQPTLILNALDDPFLGDNCYPTDIASTSDILHLLTPKYGGHVGFARSRNDRDFMLDHIVSFISYK